MDNILLNDPEFNSGITYLQRLSMLFSVAHVNATNDHNYEDWYMVLNQIFIELAPRLLTMSKIQVKKKSEEKTKDDIKNELYERLVLLKKAAANKNYQTVWNYHLELNITAHKLGLVMRDSDSRLAAEIER